MTKIAPMRCAICGRGMKEAAGSIFAGGVGPSCARRAGLRKPTKAATARIRVIQPGEVVETQEQLSLLPMLEGVAA